MWDDEQARIFEESIKNCHSNIDAPIVGKIITPQCKSCKFSDFHYGTWDEPECAIYGEIPLKYDMNREECPKKEAK